MLFHLPSLADSAHHIAVLDGGLCLLHAGFQLLKILSAFLYDGIHDANAGDEFVGGGKDIDVPDVTEATQRSTGMVPSTQFLLAKVYCMPRLPMRVEPL